MMPYITAFFMPRAEGDRPLVVPEGAVNFAFIGQFAETPRDTIFTTEYSMRTAMEAVYTLLDIDRGVPEVWGSVFDLRVPAQRDGDAARRQAGNRHEHERDRELLAVARPEGDRAPTSTAF